MTLTKETSTIQGQIDSLIAKRASEGLSPDEEEALLKLGTCEVERLQSLTQEANEIKKRASSIASDRRDAIVNLRTLGWSFRRIGDQIGVSGQRIDSMRKLGNPGSREVLRQKSWNKRQREQRLMELGRQVESNGSQ